MSQQSQTKFVETVARWSKQECLQNLDTALPKALAKLEESAYIADSIKILKLICQLFLPCVPTEELEDRLFSQMCPVASELVESSLNKIQLNLKGALKDSVEELRDILQECIQWLMDIGQCIETCVRQILELAPALELSYVCSLLPCAVNVLKKLYTHCKESTDMYGDLVEQLSEPLTAVFKQAHSLQTILLNALEKLQRSGPPLEENVQVLTFVCVGLFETCTVVTSLDVKSTISIWRGISRLCNQQLSLLRDRLDVCPMICFLCEEIQSSYDYLFQLCRPPDPESLSQGDDKAFSKAVKIVSFQMKVLVALLRDFTHYLGNCEDRVLNLLIGLLKRLPPSLKADQMTEKQEAELRVQVVSATSPIIKHLLGNRAFRSAIVTTHGQDEADHLPLLLLQLNILDVLPKNEVEVMDFWLSPMNHSKEDSSISLLSAIFELTKICFVEMRVPVMLPGVMVTGQVQKMVSLYEFVATHLCGFIGACPSHHFSHLEDILLHQVIHGDNMSYSLTVDCWCFLARYGTASVCRDQVHVLLSARVKLALQKRKPVKHILMRLDNLIQRLIKFMSPKDQSGLVKEFPPKSHPSLWSSLLTNGLAKDIILSVQQDLSSWALNILTAQEGKFSNVITALLILTKNVNATPRSQQQVTELTNIVRCMWAQVKITDKPQSLTYIDKLLELTAALVKSLTSQTVVGILDVLKNILEKSSLPVSISILTLLSAIVNTDLIELPLVSDRICLLLHQLLRHDSPLVQHKGLMTLEEFAKSSSQLVDKCIKEDQRMDKMWNKYIFLVQNKALAPAFETVDYLKSVKELKQMQNSSQNLSSQQDAIDDWIDENSQKEERDESSPKVNNNSVENSPREESSDNKSTKETSPREYYQNILDKLNSVATTLEEKQKDSKNQPPAWFVDAANEAVTRISFCLPGHDWFESME